ncbi:MAG TPA: VWA domain-containing protein [Desulfuromonadaceae bacterium]|nr:VWA domain-containing protein [Desulfuromonadaceae bacterium]
MRFEHFHILWLLLVVPPGLWLFFWWRERVRQRLVTQFVEARLLASLTVGLSPARRKARQFLMVLASAFLIVALARPQRGFDLEEVEQRGLDIVVAVDTSKSMLATDIAPNRLARAKLAVMELMQRAGTDRMGLVAFAGEAFLACPLTVDNTAFQQTVQALDVNTIPRGGTALAEAITAATTAFKEQGNHKVLVLLTDGEDNDDGAVEAARAAAKEGLKIFTVGIGTADGELLRVKDANGNEDYVRDPQGNVVKSHLNESLLKEIAEAGGGFYLPLRGAGAMDALYDRGLASLPKTVGKEKLLRRYHEQFQWPLGVAILLLLAEMFLPERVVAGRRKAESGRQKTAARAGAVALMVVVLMSEAAGASPANALRAYRSGNFTNALEEYSRLAAVKTNDLRLVFNAGDAAYRATNYDRAEELFQRVTLAPDLPLQQKGFYNLGNTQFQEAKDAKDLDGLQEGFERAEKSFVRAVDLNTNDVDAVANLAFVKNAIEQIKQFRAAMLRAKAQADAAVQRAEFHRALEIIAPLQKTVAAKQFEEFTKKLKDIDDIATPHQP